MRGWVIAAATLVLSACGGGGSSPAPTEQAPVVTAEVAAGAESLQLGVLSAPTTTIVTGADGGIALTAESASLQGLAQSEVVFLPAAPDQGLSVPFVGKVVSTVSATGLTEIKLAPANVEDAYSSLQWDIDTARTGASVVGVIAPKNATVRFSTRPAPLNQAGLAITDKLTLDGNKLSGTITLEHQLEYEGKQIVLFAETELSGVTVRSKGDFNVKNIASDNGWAEFTAVVSGDMGAKVGLRAPDLLTIPSLATLLKDQKIWDKLKWTGSDNFKLEGLEGDDKKGRFPIGGVVLTPCPAGVCPIKFTGSLSNTAISASSLAPTVILWVYMDMNGKISFSGETGVRVRGYHFEQGYEFKAVKAKLEAKRIDVATPQAVEIYGNGKLDTTQRLGISVAADILVGGIRPSAVNAFVGGKYEGNLEGDLSYAIKPATGWSGYGCVTSKLWAGIQLDANFRLRAELPVDLYFKKFELGGVVERAITGQPVAFFEKDLGSSCIATGPFALKAVVRGADPANDKNALVNIDFSVAYNNANVRPLTDKWALRADCANCTPLEFEIPSNKAGIDVVSLPVGPSYTLTLQARKDDWVIREATTTVSVGNKPVVNFGVALNNSNCSNLRLSATATAASGRTISAYTWSVKRTGGTTQAYTGNPVNAVVLPSCGETAITLTVTDSAGFVTAVSRTVNTSALAPSVSSIWPTSATIDQSVVFTVTGQNLPLTAVMSISDAICGTPTSRSATGFSVLCTPLGTGGTKTVTVKTNTQVNGGTVIDASRSIEVSTDSFTPFQLTGASAGVVRFVDAAGASAPIPSDAMVRIVPLRFQNNAAGWDGPQCKLSSSGAFGKDCRIYGSGVAMAAAFADPTETFQVVVFKNHIDPAKWDWNCKEDLYGFPGSRLTNGQWSLITVRPQDYQDRSQDICN